MNLLFEECSCQWGLSGSPSFALDFLNSLALQSHTSNVSTMRSWLLISNLLYQNRPLRIHKMISKESTVVINTKIIVDCILTTNMSMCWDLYTDTLEKKELTKEFVILH